MITKALYDYLTDSRDLKGPAETEFVCPQTLGPLTIHNRNEARRFLRDRVGNAVYNARRPSGTQHHTAVTLRIINVIRDYDLRSDDGLADAMIQIDCWTRGPDAAMRAEHIGNLIRLCVSSYYEGDWGGVSICGTTIERDGLTVELPKDGSDYWAFLYSFDLRVFYQEAHVQLK